MQSTRESAIRKQSISIQKLLHHFCDVSNSEDISIFSVEHCMEGVMVLGLGIG